MYFTLHGPHKRYIRPSQAVAELMMFTSTTQTTGRNYVNSWTNFAKHIGYADDKINSYCRVSLKQRLSQHSKRLSRDVKGILIDCRFCVPEFLSGRKCSYAKRDICRYENVRPVSIFLSF